MMSEQDFMNFKLINSKIIEPIDLSVDTYTSFKRTEKKDQVTKKEYQKLDNINVKPFTHLHVHTQFSVLQATTDIDSLINKAADMKMPAVAITDHNFMYGVCKFIDNVKKHPVNENTSNQNKLNLKPIIGCELNVCNDHKDKSNRDNGSQIPFLCKNIEGFYNLSKLSLFC